jgi:hypothetical protein
MTDGRNYSNWQPGAEVNKTLRTQAGIKSNWQYRQYLQENASQIISLDQQAAFSCKYCLYCQLDFIPACVLNVLFTSAPGCQFE